MDLHRGQRQLTNDIAVLDLQCLIDGLSLDPLRSQRGGSNRRTATEGLELRVFDYVCFRVDFDLQLHYVTALRRSHQAGANLGARLVECANVAGVRIVIKYLIAVSHPFSPAQPRTTPCYIDSSHPKSAAKFLGRPSLQCELGSAAHCTFFRSTPSFAIS